MGLMVNVLIPLPPGIDLVGPPCVGCVGWGSGKPVGMMGLPGRVGCIVGVLVPAPGGLRVVVEVLVVVGKPRRDVELVPAGGRPGRDVEVPPGAKIDVVDWVTGPGFPVSPVSGGGISASRASFTAWCGMAMALLMQRTERSKREG